MQFQSQMTREEHESQLNRGRHRDVRSEGRKYGGGGYNEKSFKQFDDIINPLKQQMSLEDNHIHSMSISEDHNALDTQNSRSFGGVSELTSAPGNSFGSNMMSMSTSASGGGHYERDLAPTRSGDSVHSKRSNYQTRGRPKIMMPSEIERSHIDLYDELSGSGGMRFCGNQDFIKRPHESDLDQLEQQRSSQANFDDGPGQRWQSAGDYEHVSRARPAADTMFSSGQFSTKEVNFLKKIAQQIERKENDLGHQASSMSLQSMSEDNIQAREAAKANKALREKIQMLERQMSQKQLVLEQENALLKEKLNNQDKGEANSSAIARRNYAYAGEGQGPKVQQANPSGLNSNAQSFTPGAMVVESPLQQPAPDALMKKFGSGAARVGPPAHQPPDHHDLQEGNNRFAFAKETFSQNHHMRQHNKVANNARFSRPDAAGVQNRNNFRTRQVEGRGWVPANSTHPTQVAPPPTNFEHQKISMPPAPPPHTQTQNWKSLIQSQSNHGPIHAQKWQNKPFVKHDYNFTPWNNKQQQKKQNNKKKTKKTKAEKKEKGPTPQVVAEQDRKQYKFRDLTEARTKYRLRYGNLPASTFQIYIKGICPYAGIGQLKRDAKVLNVYAMGRVQSVSLPMNKQSEEYKLFSKEKNGKTIRVPSCGACYVSFKDLESALNALEIINCEARFKKKGINAYWSKLAVEIGNSEGLLLQKEAREREAAGQRE